MSADIKRSKESDELLSYLTVVPPDLSAIEEVLKEKHYDRDVVSRAGFDFVDYCFDDARYYNEEFKMHQYEDPVLDMSFSSAYMPQIIGLLLKYGLDPNASCDSDNIMAEVKFVVNGYAAADTLAILLEHGGRIDLVFDGSSLAGDLNFDVIFDAFNQRDRRAYDSLVHCWFVMLAYADNIIKGKEAVTVFGKQRCDTEIGDFRITDLKQHRNYCFGLSNVSERGEDWSLHIFDKRTRWEVARL